LRRRGRNYCRERRQGHERGPGRNRSEKTVAKGGEIPLKERERGERRGGKKRVGGSGDTRRSPTRLTLTNIEGESDVEIGKKEEETVSRLDPIYRGSKRRLRGTRPEKKKL